MRRLILIIISIIFSLSVFYSYIYFFLGGKYYNEAKNSIKKLPNNQQREAEQFFGVDSNFVYSGVYMTSGFLGQNGVWVWGSAGPRFFYSDMYTVYSQFTICPMTNDLDISESTVFKDVERNIYTNIKEWIILPKVGDFIVIKISDPDNGGNQGKSREVIIYDWWIFDPSKDLLEQCKN